MADNSFSYVSLLLHCNGSDAATTFTDSGPDARTVSVFGNAQLDTAQQKFGTASALFDGTGDYLTIPDEPGLNLDSGDFTVELWVRLNSTAATRTIINKALTTGNSQYRIFYNTSTGRFNATVRNSANTTTTTCVQPTATTVVTGTWYHLAFVRSGDNFNLYLNGVSGVVQTLSGSLFATTETVSIGGDNNGSTPYNGWLDEIRITKGYARYTADFTAPTAEFETGTIPTEKNFAYVALLLHGDGSDASTTVTDSSSSAKTVTVLGNAQIDTAQSQFGGASILFDGTTDYLTVPNSTGVTGVNLSSGNFTVEMWVRFNALGANQYLGRQASGTTMWALLYDNGASRLRFIANNAAASQSIGINGIGAPSTGVWYHVAGVRDGNLFRLFIDGALQGSATLAGGGALISTTNNVSFGADASGATALNGWLDDIRITKGVCRYTAAFTAPTAAFQNGNDTLGHITTAAMFGEVQVTGWVDIVGHITTEAILGGTAGAVMYGGLAVGTITHAAILGGNAGSKVFGSLVHARVVMPTILGMPDGNYMLARHDFSASVVDRTIYYVMDLVTDIDADTRVRVPISSWGATLQVTNASYASCVVPACGQWLDTLYAATHFIVYRRTTLADGSVLEAEIARAPLETLQVDQGPTNHTASLSGYSDGAVYEATEDPDPMYDRTLTGIRSLSSYTSGVRVRCAIDWLLRPGQRAFYTEDTSLIVSYMNMYAQGNDAYMDVGERVV